MASELTRTIKERALAEGTHLMGIAPVERFEGAPSGHHPTDLLRGARSVVVIAHRFPQALLQGHAHGRHPALIPEDEWFNIRQWYYSPGGAGFWYPTANWRLQMIALQVAIALEDQGYLALPIPASGYRARDRYSIFSHRHAAVLAGLGAFGWNNLLLTPQYGPRVRLDSIITTAPLDPDPMLAEPVCLREACGLCLKASDCFGEQYEIELAGKVMELARFSGTCPDDACRNGERPFIRYCYGVCPVGKTLT